MAVTRVVPRPSEGQALIGDRRTTESSLKCLAESPMHVSVSHVPIALVGNNRGPCGGRYPAAIRTAYLTVGLSPRLTTAVNV